MQLEHPEYHSIVRMIDIDGTICVKHKPDNIDLFEPLEGCVEQINKWYHEGDYIIFWTARLEKYRVRTMIDLQDAGFRFHQLIMEKPYSHDIHIYDDNVITSHAIKRNHGLGEYIEKAEHAGEILKEFD